MTIQYENENVKARVLHHPSFQKPEMTAWDGHSFESFNLIREITDEEDTIDDIPKRDYYQADENKFDWISLYKCPGYLFTELETVLFIDKDRSYPFNNALSACSLYGVNRLINFKGYKELQIQLERFQRWSKEGRFEPGEKQDIINIAEGLKLIEDNNGSGFKRQKNFKCPKYIKTKFSKPVKDLKLSQSSLIQRFIMDALIEQDSVDKQVKEVMSKLVEDLYSKIIKLEKRLRVLLTAMGVDEI